MLLSVYHQIEAFCPSDDSSKKFRTFLSSVEWSEHAKTEPRLPWDCNLRSCVLFVYNRATQGHIRLACEPTFPPPNLLTKGPLARLAILDPEGFAKAEQALDSFFPRLEYVVSKSTGSLVGDRYGPKRFVNRYEASVAFISTEAFEDRDSLSARMIQARFTGFGRFSCLAMLEFASDQSNAAAGTSAPEAAQRNNPASGYNSPFDRNWLMCAQAPFNHHTHTLTTPLTARSQVFRHHLHREPAETDWSWRTRSEYSIILERSMYDTRGVSNARPDGNVEG